MWISNRLAMNCKIVFIFYTLCLSLFDNFFLAEIILNETQVENYLWETSLNISLLKMIYAFYYLPMFFFFYFFFVEILTN